MDPILHPLATASSATGRVFAEGDRVVSYLVREVAGGMARRDLLEREETGMPSAEEVLCRWVTVFKPKPPEANPDRALKLTAENLFLTLADPGAERSAVNTPLLQFLALLLERKKLIKLRGVTEDGERQIYEHMPSHQLYEVPVGTLDDAFFLRIREELGVLVGGPTAKAAATPPAA
jgi:hypothetical protein